MRRRSLLVGLPALIITPTTQSARAQKVDAVKLGFTGPLGDKVLGKSTAPITVIEYASLTCGHCMRFHVEIWPAFKAKYVDTGHVQFILREFPLDALAMGAAMLARCSGDNWYAMTDMFFQKKEEWAHSKTPADTLRNLVGQMGMPADKFDACLTDDATFQGLKKVAEHAEKELGVRSTPTFFINGEMRTGVLTLAEFDKILAPLLEKK